MDAIWLLLLIFTVISTSEYSETVKPTCEDYNLESFYLLEGEALYFVPYIFHDPANLPDEEFTWYKNKSEVEYISSDEKDRIHNHGAALFFLNLLTEDSGLYTSRHIDQSGKCGNYYLNVTVFKTSNKNNSKLLYGEIKNSDENKKVPCPQLVKKTCNMFTGNFTWYKNFSPLEGEHDHLRVIKATKDDEGIYTCVCTWTHNDMVYNSSGSKMLRLRDKVGHRKVEILSPTDKEQFADEGFEIKLNCSVFCGTNAQNDCHASWNINGKPFKQMNGYNQTIKIVAKNTSQNTISTVTLTIAKVSAQDFQTEFKCIGVGFYSTNSTTLRLKRRESVTPWVIGKLCVLFFFVFAAVLVKCFIIDLTLFFRPCFTVISHKKDERMYDAYVVYRTHNVDKVTEDKLCWFVTNILPSVLEEKCGYRLFIHGRDDMPGEDNLEQVEVRMQQSRRLIVILMLGLESQPEITEKTPVSPEIPMIGGFDWQVGFHHALVQNEMKVILIQLGDTGPQGYTHLSPSLQHLIRKSAPIKWPEGSRGAAAWNSRFWKRVRYLMPATPARKCLQSSII